MCKQMEEMAERMTAGCESNVEFSVSRVEFEAQKGRQAEGEFVIKSAGRFPVRGTVCSSEPRMECLVEEFEGEEVTIPYRFHSDGLREGDILSGEFFILCSRREYSLSFAAKITDGSFTLPEFADLARQNWEEAKSLFGKKDFLSRLRQAGERERLLYEGLSKGAARDLNLEEFLLSCGLKEQVFLSAQQTEFYYYGITDRIRLDILLTKGAWGYVEAYVSSDAEFIEIEKKHMTSEDFLGSEAEFSFYINPKRMHGGKNFGRIYIKQKSKEIVVTVCASLRESEETEFSKAVQIRRLNAKLLSDYVDYRLKKIVTGKWTILTCETADKLLEIEPDNQWYRLMKAQALFTNGQRQDSEWILKEFKRMRKDQRSPQWGYYLYICALMEHEELYISRLEEEIKRIYLEHEENPILFWCLLFLREDYAKNSRRKLKAIEKRIYDGANSPLFYVEAYSLYRQEPYLLSHFGGFEQKILYFALKHGALTKAVAEQTVAVFSDRTPFHRLAFLVLEACYEMLSDNRSLSVICGYLIKNQKYGARYFPWYALGIEEKLRITGLYEAYLLSMDLRGIQEIPQIIQMYFKYNNQLGSRQKTVLYVNLIAEKNQKPQLFEQHVPAMERFAYEQMAKGRIDDNLAVIYEEMLSSGKYPPQMADALSDVLFAHRLTCFDPDARRVVILQNQLVEPTEAPLINGAAYFPLYSNDYCIFIEDCYGNRLSGSIPYQLERLMNAGKYLRISMQSPMLKLPCLFYYFSSRKGQEVFEEKDLRYFQAALYSPKTDGRYKALLLPKLMRLLHELSLDGEMEFALKQTDVSFLQEDDRKEILNFCILHKLYGQASRIAGEYGADLLGVEERAQLLSYRIQTCAFEKDQALLLSCAGVCIKGYADEAILKYLCSYYKSSVSRMTEVYLAAKEAGVDISQYAERFLTQMLYTEQFFDGINDVYLSCRETCGNSLAEAYFHYFSYQNFVNGRQAPEGFFQALKEWRESGQELHEICGLALLKEFASHPVLTVEEEAHASLLLQDFLFQGVSFAFYRDLSKNLRQMYQLYDKYFIEYHTEKKHPVWLRYMFEGSQREAAEEMTETFEGFFVKELILFFGETVSYTIEEECDGERMVKASGKLTYLQEEFSQGRYDRLNALTAIEAEEDVCGLADGLAEYRRIDDLVSQEFTIIK